MARKTQKPPFPIGTHVLFSAYMEPEREAVVNGYDMKNGRPIVEVTIVGTGEMLWGELKDVRAL